MNTLYLASHSPRRKELIQVLDRPFEICGVDIPEPVRKGEKPEAVVCALSFEKAFTAATQTGYEGCFIGSDTVVSVDGVIFGKPETREEARQMLEALSGRTHQVYTGLALVDLSKNVKVVKSVCTQVVFRTLTADLIEWYLNTGEYEGKAGAYGIQGYGSRLVECIEGDFFNVVGLPVAALDQLLTELAL